MNEDSTLVAIDEALATSADGHESLEVNAEAWLRFMRQELYVAQSGLSALGNILGKAEAEKDAAGAEVWNLTAKIDGLKKDGWLPPWRADSYVDRISQLERELAEARKNEPK